jgi:hypothetical protein
MTSPTLEIVMNWHEAHISDFNIVVVLDNIGDLCSIERQWAWLVDTLLVDVGLELDDDYIEYIEEDRHITSNSFTIRVNHMEHYTMLKLHYGA